MISENIVRRHWARRRTNIQWLPTDQGQCLIVPCQQCPGLDDHIRLELAVEDERKLLINNVELYPDPDAEHGLFMTAFIDDDGVKGGKSREHTIGYGLSVAFKARDEVERVELVDVDCRIRQVDRQRVYGVPTIHVQLIKLATGQVLIGNVATRNDAGGDCSAAQCWAYQFAHGVFRSISEDFLHCCARQRLNLPGNLFHNTTHLLRPWRYALQGGPEGRTLQPALLDLCAVAMLVSLMVLLYKANGNKDEYLPWKT
ncbi:hypothetical protein DCS_03137 [Drechmeria coniospora]|uniref:DUF7728 domain-containing protein n=1 Tax=Drechmeria coniospora TaxID=98403 RepID=A0A151GY76_DRECN|nr:hypothetical protein DCS_03137 [Drechmeria coniospora]KYK61992.1 hypothetical protein DCS_03137 [Drechmeria coniospora]